MRDISFGITGSIHFEIAIELKSGIVPVRKFFDPYTLTRAEVVALGFEEISSNVYRIPAWLKPYIKTGITLIDRLGNYRLNSYHSRVLLDGVVDRWSDLDHLDIDDFIVAFNEDGLTSHRWHAADRREVEGV